MNISTLKQAARTAQQQEAKGLATKEQAASAQRAFDVARTQPQRDADLARSRADHVRQQAIWDSINDCDPNELRRQALELDCIRKVTVKGGLMKFYDVEVTRYVPPTGQWANWRDADAIRYYGIASIQDLLERFSQLSEEPFDGTYRHLWIFKGGVQ